MKKFLTKDGIEHFSEHFGIDFSQKYLPPKCNTGILMFIADLHLPFHHTKYLDMTLRHAKEIGVETLFIVGDFMDLYSVSHFRKTTYKTFKDEFREAYLELKDICRRFSKVKLMFSNHDHRFAKFIYDKIDKPELLPFCHINILEELIELLPNVEIISQNVLGRNIGYVAQYKNVLMTHIEKSSIIPGRVAQLIHELFSSKWKKCYGLKDYDILLQAHNHSANITYIDDVIAIQMPCLIDLSQIAFDYIFDGKFKGGPPALGFITALEKNGYIDSDTIKLRKFKGY